MMTWKLDSSRIGGCRCVEFVCAPQGASAGWTHVLRTSDTIATYSYLYPALMVLNSGYLEYIRDPQAWITKTDTTAARRMAFSRQGSDSQAISEAPRFLWRGGDALDGLKIPWAVSLDTIESF